MANVLWGAHRGDRQLGSRTEASMAIAGTPAGAECIAIDRRLRVWWFWIPFR